ncbi:MAG: SdpI family protein [Syntrophales bacterium]|nr:SdpI family protein [Syntrophales bacterium]
MLSVNAKTAITLVILGSAIFLLLIPLYSGRVKMNRVYGIRIRKAFESEENWFKVNRYGAAALMYWAIGLMITGIMCLFIPPEFILTVAKTGFILIIIPVIQIMRYAKRL